MHSNFKMAQIVFPFVSGHFEVWTSKWPQTSNQNWQFRIFYIGKMGHFEILVILKFRVTFLLERDRMKFLTVWFFDRTFSSAFCFFSCRVICWQLHINFNVSLSAWKGLKDVLGLFYLCPDMHRKNWPNGFGKPAKTESSSAAELWPWSKMDRWSLA